MRVREVMTTDVVTADADEPVRDAVGRMLDAGIGSVVVRKDGNPTGILTKVDVMRVGHRYDRPLSEVPVYAATSHPLITIQPSTTVRAASVRMFDNGIHHLPVADGVSLEGMVTATDLLEAQDSIFKEAREQSDQRDEWDA